VGIKELHHQRQLITPIIATVSIEITRSHITQTQERHTQVHTILFHRSRVKQVILYLLITSIIDKTLLSNSHTIIISNNLYNLITTTLIISSLSILTLPSILIYNLFKPVINLAPINQDKILKLSLNQILSYKK